jgi:hypothetical protein
MSAKPKHNPERRAWRGRSHKKGGTRIKDLRVSRVGKTPIAHLTAAKRRDVLLEIVDIVRDRDNVGADCTVDDIVMTLDNAGIDAMTDEPW